MLKIAITGSTGLVGSRIQELLYKDFSFIPLLQSHIDITHSGNVKDFVDKNDFDIMLHLAGYTNVDQAEKERDLCEKINVTGTRNVFNATKNKGKRFIYISTDFVFDGKNPPYFEDSNPNPIGWYAKTKYEGEKIVKNDGMIVRISYPYRAVFDQKKDLVRGIKSHLENGNKLTMITDVIITPTFIDDVAFSLKHLFTNFSNEVFHIVGSESYTPYETALKIAQTFKLDESLVGKSTYDEFYKGNKIRSKKSVVKSKKNNFWKMKSLDDGLKILRDQLLKKQP